MISYADKTFLIVDDFAEFRRSLRGMVQQLGAEDIDMAGTGEEAIALCVNRRYDIVLSDYNLGDGKDGQQILEELIERKLLKRGAIFVMITAENSTAMVMGALEYQPDAYITKPFNKVALQARLDKLMEKRLALAEIDQALEKNDIDKAIALCDREISQKSRYALACLRTKAELLEQEDRLAEAATIYASLSQDRPVPWAMLGLARVTLGQGEAEEARKQFEDVIRQLPTLTPAYDGLAKTWLGLGETVKAQQVLLEAVRRSPKAVLRQAELGQVASKNGDLDTATRAFRQAVNLGRHSVHKSPESYLKLADCLVQGIGSNPVEDKRASDEISKTLFELDSEYKDDKQISMRSLLTQGSLAHKQKRTKDAENAAVGASKLLQELDSSSLPPEIALDVADKFMALGKQDVAKAVLRTCAELYSDNPEVLAKCAEQLADNSVIKHTDQALALNALGIAEFEQKKYDAALLHFREAVKLAPRNISIVLNTAQTLLEKYRGQPQHALLEECQGYLDQVRKMPDTDKRYKRFQGLMQFTQQMRKA
ncbi:response regulator [Permianibacter sp. IMCC34836]|uniref:tetratricopeptide repeat-containing response regulator n=1 Tax=Permianibacter fluminis TaxID=2738515 RepID=UPI001555307A|nr:tetratricopeptide repeat-containing response regulator [Permianibacter fluminis]NQD38202.1 response regulator [Permianibacter fluminis]